MRFATDFGYLSSSWRSLFETKSRGAKAILSLRDAWNRLHSCVLEWVQSLKDQHCCRQCVRELEALDDRILRDIGIARHQIPELVRAQINETRRASRRQQLAAMKPATASHQQLTA